MFMFNDTYTHWEQWEFAEDPLNIMGAMNAIWLAETPLTCIKGGKKFQ